MSQKIFADNLILAAKQHTGLKDFGGDTFKAGLDALIYSLNTDLSLPELSAQYFQGIILQLLVNRLEVTRLIKTHPEILEEIIEKPVFIIGLPRSGTTILHTLMALDPCSRFLRNYECSGAILPPPELIPGAIDPRIEATHKAMEGFLGAAPQLRGINGLNFMAYGTAECQNLMAHEFCHLGYSAGSSLFSYGDWLSRTDLEPAYKTHKLLLQILQWKLPNERWVLKAPIHLFGLDHLLATYPDAEIVFTHRAPYDAIQSGISMIYHWTEFTTQQADIEAIVNWWPKLMAGALKKALKVRKKSDATKFYDAKFTDIAKEPCQVVENIYEHSSVRFNKAHGKRMTVWLRDNPRSKFGKHDPTREKYGLDPLVVKELYQFYKP